MQAVPFLERLGGGVMLGDIGDNALPKKRLALVVVHQQGVVAQPHPMAVLMPLPVFAVERLAGRV
jgi:hypothetical protein